MGVEAAETLENEGRNKFHAGQHGGSGIEQRPVTEIVPQRLYGQLRDGGRLVGVFATSRPARATIVTASHGDYGHRALFDAAAPLLPGMELVPAFVF